MINLDIMKTRPLTYLVKASLLSLIIGLAAVSCTDAHKIGDAFYGEDEPSITGYMELATDLEQDTAFGKFLKIAEVANLNSTLRGFNPKGTNYTLLLPTNKAVDNFIATNPDYSSFKQLTDSVDFCRSICRYHVIMSKIERKDFGFGALGDSTASGDFLTVGFESVNGGVNNAIVINNTAEVIRFDEETSNGVIHIVDAVLEPNVYTSYQWLTIRPDLSIFTEALEKTGLADTLNTAFRKNSTGSTRLRNLYTLVVEPDSVFNKRGINTFDDLVERYSTTDDLTDKDNGLYQFIAYHIIEANFYLNDVTTDLQSYNTYSILPMSIVSDQSYKKFSIPGIKINKGIDPIDTVIISGDSVVLNYVPVLLQESNQTSINGAIHFITELLEMRLITASDKNIYPRDMDPLFNELWNKYGKSQTTFIEEYENPDAFEKISWGGTPIMEYWIWRETQWFSESIYLNGFFDFEFTTPRILPGNYNMVLYVHRQNTRKYGEKAIIQTYVDNVPTGGPINLSDSNNPGGRWSRVASVEFDSYQEHKINIKAQIGGSMILYRVQFAKR